VSGTDLRQRLAAILAADVAGYSRLMAADERATVAALDTARSVFKARIESDQGRVIDMAGDSVLAVFETATGAVSAALTIQKELNSSGDTIPEDRRMRFRIGVHLGDVFEKTDGTVYGDGVNIAARLEGLAEPGGITVSESVRTAVQGKVGASFQEQGEQKVKNIPEPVRAYRVKVEGDTVSKPNSAAGEIDLSLPDKPLPVAQTAASAAQTRRRWLVSGVPGLGIAAVLVIGILRFWSPAATSTSPAMSVAVAQLVARKNDPEAAQFAAALVRSLVSRLGRIRGNAGQMRVVASNIDPAGDVTDLSELGRRLRVRYVVDGTVVRSGQGYTVSLQLLDAASRAQLWSQRDTLQDSDVSAESSVKLEKLTRGLRSAAINAETQRVIAQPILSLSAEELVLRALATWDKNPTLTGALEARQLVDRSVLLDPDLVSARLTRVFLTDQEGGLGPKVDRTRIVRDIDKDTDRAVELDPDNPSAWAWRAIAQLYLGRWDAAPEAIDRAIRLEPENPWLLGYQATIMNVTGRPSDALTILDRARAEMSPNDATYTALVQCQSHLLLGEAGRAVTMCEKAAIFKKNWNVQVLLVAAYADQGDWPRANAAKAELLRMVPGFTVAQARAFDEPLHPEYAKLAQKYVYEGLRKAGIPEQ